MSISDLRALVKTEPHKQIARRTFSIIIAERPSWVLWTLLFEPGFRSASKKISLKLFNSARKMVDVSVYIFTSEELKAALVKLMEEEVRARVLTNATEARGVILQVAELRVQGVEVCLGNSMMHHHKMVIIDRNCRLNGDAEISALLSFDKEGDEDNLRSLFETDEELRELYEADAALLGLFGYEEVTREPCDSGEDNESMRDIFEADVICALLNEEAIRELLEDEDHERIPRSLDSPTHLHALTRAPIVLGSKATKQTDLPRGSHELIASDGATTHDATANECTAEDARVVWPAAAAAGSIPFQIQGTPEIIRAFLQNPLFNGANGSTAIALSIHPHAETHNSPTGTIHSITLYLQKTQGASVYISCSFSLLASNDATTNNSNAFSLPKIHKWLLFILVRL